MSHAVEGLRCYRTGTVLQCLATDDEVSYRLAIGFGLLGLGGGWLGRGSAAVTCRAAGGSCPGSALSGLAATAAMECGWIVTEVGRQPWVVYKIMLTPRLPPPRQA